MSLAERATYTLGPNLNIESLLRYFLCYTIKHLQNGPEVSLFASGLGTPDCERRVLALFLLMITVAVSHPAPTHFGLC